MEAYRTSLSILVFVILATGSEVVGRAALGPQAAVDMVVQVTNAQRLQPQGAVYGGAPPPPPPPPPSSSPAPYTYPTTTPYYTPAGPMPAGPMPGGPLLGGLIPGGPFGGLPK